MKNAIKKISAVALAFTLLGTGAAAANNGSTKTGNTIAASAAEDVTLKFNDVNGTDAFVYAVQYVYSRNIMNGTSDNTFSPSMAMTRAQFVTALYNMAGKPKVNYKPVFDDVKKGQTMLYRYEVLENPASEKTQIKKLWRHSKTGTWFLPGRGMQ